MTPSSESSTSPSHEEKPAFTWVHHVARWYYRIVFGLIVAGIVGSLVQGFVETGITTGTLAFPRLSQLEHTYVWKIATQSPVAFWTITAFALGAGVLGFLADRQLKRLQESSQRHQLEGALKRMVKDTLEIQVTGVEKAEAHPFETLPLPPAKSGLVGRADVLEWLEEHVRNGETVAITGLGGIGKTALVAQCIRDLRTEFECGVGVIQANEYDDPILIVSDLVTQFVPGVSALRHQPAMTLDRLFDAAIQGMAECSRHGGRVLIVIDNIEPSIVGRIKVVLDRLLTAGATYVLTARSKVPSELVQYSYDLGQLASDDAATLFLKLSGRSPSSGEQADFDTILRILEGHPLAITLAARELADHPLESLHEYRVRIEPSGAAVSLAGSNGGVKDGDRYQLSTNIGRVFASSANRLPDAARDLFIAFGALHGRGATITAVKALGMATGQSAAEVQANLELIINTSLIHYTSGSVPGDLPRIELHPLVLQYTQAQLLRWSRSTVSRLRDALAQHYAEWAATADLAALQEDDANLTAAVDWAVSAAPRTRALLVALVSTLAPYWDRLYRYEETIRWIQATLDVLPKRGAQWHPIRTQLMARLAKDLFALGNITEAERMFTEALALAQHSRDNHLTAICLRELGHIAWRKGDLPKADGFFHQSLRLFKDLHDRHEEARTLIALGDEAFRQGHSADAESYYRQGLALLEAVNDVQGAGIAFRKLADVEIRLGQTRDAQGHFQQSHDLLMRAGDKQGAGTSVRALGDIARRLGENTAARHYFQESWQLMRQAKDGEGQGFALRALGALALRDGDLESARTYFEQSLQCWRDIADHMEEANTRVEFGRLALRKGDLDAAERYFQEAMPVMLETENAGAQIIIWRLLGKIAHQRNEISQAEDDFRKSLDLARRIRDSMGEGKALYCLGEIASLQNKTDEAEQYLRTALSIARVAEARNDIARALEALAALILRRGDTSEEGCDLASEALTVLHTVGAHTEDIERVQRIAREFGCEAGNPE